jgi:hypothetical protein
MDRPMTGVHSLVDPNSHKKVGGYAPDVLTGEHDTLVLFLGISRARGSVCCLGLCRVEDEYRRVGLGFWDGTDWDAIRPRYDGNVVLK